ncbi:hypothetical protein K1719_022794 [Acacia pycnantha]|nr:hypothetical protein K1719_022794 [Acacia pycnantha]
MDSSMENLCPTKMVKTCILSRNWRYMWTSVNLPKLEFNATIFENISTGGHVKRHEIANVIFEVLLQHHGPINEFILCIPRAYPIRIKCLSLWILFLSRRNIPIASTLSSHQLPQNLEDEDDGLEESYSQGQIESIIGKSLWLPPLKKMIKLRN